MSDLFIKPSPACSLSSKIISIFLPFLYKKSLTIFIVRDDMTVVPPCFSTYGRLFFIYIQYNKKRYLRLGNTCHHCRLHYQIRTLTKNRYPSSVTRGRGGTTIISSTRLPNPFLMTLHTASQHQRLSVM